MTTNVKRCECCGDDHVDLEAFPLPAPIPQPDLFGDRTILYTHRVECPKTGRVLLVAIEGVGRHGPNWVGAPSELPP